MGVDQTGHDQHAARVDRSVGPTLKGLTDLQDRVVLEEDGAIAVQPVRATFESHHPAALDERAHVSDHLQVIAVRQRGEWGGR